ncbi:XRE family transcriptional regulator [Alteromonas oceanisediminis]|uniref:XRE family transcriptional regulator n=1 Tax=Alteromonas oceanisediminis TaxID=2836180 RepID=UPI001BDAF0C0|nr:XRE family transcriptional regulator [Alteromonas oceanisediminis]MBT0585597.1 XRE family transcriptional regulator [Alteromonas oceanisediminis]
MQTLKQLRQRSAVKQEIIALSLNVSSSAVSKLEAKEMADISVHKLSKYIKSLGGELAVVITLPDGEIIDL